jgi:hypothetical protein
MKTRLDLKFEQIHFIDSCIVNLKHLERYTQKFEDPGEQELLEDILKTLTWLYSQQERVTDEINDLKGYPHYEPKT